MFSVNEVKLIGNLGQDVELRFTGSGVAVTTLSVATSYKPKDKPEKTTWHQVQVWDKQAEACASYLKKGSRVFVSGRIETTTWEGQDGKTQYKQIVVADRVGFLSSPSEPREGSAGGGSGPAGVDDSDQIPF